MALTYIKLQGDRTRNLTALSLTALNGSQLHAYMYTNISATTTLQRRHITTMHN